MLRERLPLWRRLRAALGARRELLAERELLLDRVMELEDALADWRRA